MLDKPYQSIKVTHTHNGTMRYVIRWSGYSSTYDSWKNKSDSKQFYILDQLYLATHQKAKDRATALTNVTDLTRAVELDGASEHGLAEAVLLPTVVTTPGTSVINCFKNDVQLHLNSPSQIFLFFQHFREFIKRHAWRS